MASIDLGTLLIIIIAVVLAFTAYYLAKKRKASRAGFDPNSQRARDTKELIRVIRGDMRKKHSELTKLFKQFDNFLVALNKLEDEKAVKLRRIEQSQNRNINSHLNNPNYSNTQPGYYMDEQ